MEGQRQQRVVATLQRELGAMSEPRRSRFKTDVSTDPIPPDPESLFRDLKTRSPEIPYLWSHQADLLRAYNKAHQATADVAFELPTGAGKTLIGLLLSEYRRRKNGERVVYLCPTRQLAHQAFEHAKEYGLNAYLLLRPNYSNINNYRLGSGIGITTYSSIFNTNPRIADAQTIVLDDAHAAEDYILGPWSVSITRSKNEALFKAVIHLLGDDLDPWFRDNLLDDAGRDITAVSDVDMLSGPSLHEHAPALRDLLDEHLRNTENPERYPWSEVRGALHACNLFISWHELLFRPIIPPTLTHAAFAGANQRIYMSATLGEGGELERVAGVPRIVRLPMPEGWERQSAGRRLFLFPDLATDRQDVPPVELATIGLTDRALVLVPRTVDISDAEQQIRDGGFDVLGASDIEQSLDSFTGRTNVALVLANRYDGLDLPGDDCRLLIMAGLPVGTNLQERFLFHRLGVNAPYRDRLRTRFTQGAGRCCRNSTDYSAVLVTGQDALDFCARRENRAGMHPELQAELEFGLRNSQDVDSATLLDYVQILFEQGSDWEEAEASIVSLRAGKAKVVDPVAATLLNVVAKEVQYSYALWKEDYDVALQLAIGVADELSSTATKGYQAWWYYLAGVVAWLDGTEHGDETKLAKARELFSRAAQRASVNWFARLARQPAAREDPQGPVEDATGIENVSRRLRHLGLYGPRFERFIAQLLEQIAATDSTSFELGLEKLGDLLGFEARRPTDEGGPDGVWMLSDKIAIAFEAKSDETADGAISLNTVRQANSHPVWVKDHCPVASDAEIFTMVVTPRTTIDERAQRIVDNVFYVHADSIRETADVLVAALRRIRAQATEQDSDHVQLVELVRQEMGAGLLLPANMLELLRRTSLEALPVVASADD